MPDMTKTGKLWSKKTKKNRLFGLAGQGWATDFQGLFQQHDVAVLRAWHKKVRTKNLLVQKKKKLEKNHLKQKLREVDPWFFNFLADLFFKQTIFGSADLIGAADVQSQGIHLQLQVAFYLDDLQLSVSFLKISRCEKRLGLVLVNQDDFFEVEDYNLINLYKHRINYIQHHDLLVLEPSTSTCLPDHKSNLSLFPHVFVWKRMCIDV